MSKQSGVAWSVMALVLVFMIIPATLYVSSGVLVERTEHGTFWELTGDDDVGVDGVKLIPVACIYRTYQYSWSNTTTNHRTVDTGMYFKDDTGLEYNTWLMKGTGTHDGFRSLWVQLNYSLEDAITNSLSNLRFDTQGFRQGNITIRAYYSKEVEPSDYSKDNRHLIGRVDETILTSNNTFNIPIHFIDLLEADNKLDADVTAMNIRITSPDWDDLVVFGDALDFNIELQSDAVVSPSIHG